MATDINTLYQQASAGDSTAAEQLFCLLGVSYRMFVRHRVMNSQDCEEIVQDALTTIAEKYRLYKSNRVSQDGLTRCLTTRCLITTSPRESVLPGRRKKMVNLI